MFNEEIYLLTRTLHIKVFSEGREAEGDGGICDLPGAVDFGHGECGRAFMAHVGPPDYDGVVSARNYRKDLRGRIIAILHARAEQPGGKASSIGVVFLPQTSEKAYGAYIVPHP